MGKFTLEVDIDGFNSIRNDPGVAAELLKLGERIAAAAGGAPDYVVVNSPTKSRARVVVITATAAAKRAEATNRTLTRAFGTARG